MGGGILNIDSLNVPILEKLSLKQPLHYYKVIAYDLDSAVSKKSVWKMIYVSQFFFFITILQDHLKIKTSL